MLSLDLLIQTDSVSTSREEESPKHFITTGTDHQRHSDVDQSDEEEMFTCLYYSLEFSFSLSLSVCLSQMI